MRTAYLIGSVVLVLALAAGGGTGLAHITPPVVLVSDQEAVLGMMSGAKKFFVREVRLAPEERHAIQKQWGWRPEGDVYRLFLGRDDAGQLVAAVTFLTEYTIHGPVRVAVGLTPDGKIKGAQVVELTEETYPGLKPLIDQGFARDYIGRDSHSTFGLSERVRALQLDSMSEFYAQVVASLMQRAAVLFEITVLKRNDKA
jgi:Na+-translocating ferredoxin:NAD+ oxidoreductase RnfG subunit